MSDFLNLWRGRARAAARVGLKSSASFDADPRAIVELARQRIAGPLGLPSLLRVHATGRPDAPAVMFGERVTTWRELDRRVDRLANALKDRLGVRAGDAALIVMRNRPEMLEAQAALARVGAAAVNVSWRSTPDELRYLAEHSGSRAILAEADIADALDAARASIALPADRYVSVGGSREGYLEYDALLASARAERVDGQEGSVVIYTSGTTGKPKGAVRKFPKEIVWNMLHILAELPMRSDDRHLAVCPMYHSTAFGFIGFTMVLGGSLVIEPTFDPERFLATVERHRVTTTAVVPTMLHRILELPEAVRRRYDTRSLHAIFSGGAPLSGELAKRVIEELGYVLYNFYGATETGLNTIATPDELLRSPGTIGHALAENEIVLLDERGHEVADGATGELWVKNAMLVSGYHRDQDATRASMREGFFSVGDLAHRDEHGLLHLDGRKRDMIISGGVNIYPAELEEVIHGHPNVAECAVVGIPDSEWGEKVRLYVVPREQPFDERELVAWARQRISNHKVPREVRVLDELPKNPTGKVLKRELRAL
ncbi:MAG: class I adenylate-forming enzyme family protein [Sandaracinaceae bacterium]